MSFLVTLIDDIIWWTLFFLVLGAVFYAADRKYGVRVYRWWYNLTHRDSLSNEIEIGFVYNRKSAVQVWWATVFSTVQTVFVIWYIFAYGKDINPLAELLLWILEVPAMWLGFKMGPLVHRLRNVRDKGFTLVDKIESGEVNVKKEARDRASALANEFREGVADVTSTIGLRNKDVVRPEEVVEEEPPLPDPRDALRQFTKRKKTQ